MTPDDWLLALLILGAALLYSAVGHGGASGYLAAMALFGLAPQVMKPTALALNILVSSVGAARFARAGHFRSGLFWPFALGSIPFAFWGGSLAVPDALFQRVLGAVLLFSAVRLGIDARARSAGGVATMPPLVLAVVLGAVIGFVSGMVGVGGGIFLSPLVLFAGWADVRQTAALSAAFILVNSVAGLAGHLASVAYLPQALPLWAAAALVGGVVGSGLGSRRLPAASLRRLLGAVLAIAGVKLILTG